MSIDDFETKIVSLVGVAGGHIGAIHSLDTMKTICRNLHCWVLPQEVPIANSGQAFNDDGTVTDPSLEERLLNVGRQVVKFADVQYLSNYKIAIIILNIVPYVALRIMSH